MKLKIYEKQYHKRDRMPDKDFEIIGNIYQGLLQPPKN